MNSLVPLTGSIFATAAFKSSVLLNGEYFKMTSRSDVFLSGHWSPMTGYYVMDV